MFVHDAQSAWHLEFVRNWKLFLAFSTKCNRLVSDFGAAVVIFCDEGRGPAVDACYVLNARETTSVL